MYSHSIVAWKSSLWFSGACLQKLIPTGDSLAVCWLNLRFPSYLYYIFEASQNWKCGFPKCPWRKNNPIFVTLHSNPGPHRNVCIYTRMWRAAAWGINKIPCDGSKWINARINITITDNATGHHWNQANDHLKYSSRTCSSAPSLVFF